jgi:retron-type reverse transcriptase
LQKQRPKGGEEEAKAEKKSSTQKGGIRELCRRVREARKTKPTERLESRANPGEPIALSPRGTRFDLEKLVNQCYDRKSGKFVGLFKIICKTEVLKMAYAQIKSNPGNLTPGGDPEKETLDGITEHWFVQTADKLGRGSYEFKPARRVMIPKPNSPLTVVSPRDKIVQEAIRLVLQVVYEPSFSDYSYGFRPGRGAHTALKDIKLRWKAPSWWLEFDIAKCYDTIARKRLLSIMREKMADVALFGCLNKMFNTKILNLHLGGPNNQRAQESALSPLLINVYLDKLDQYVQKKKSELESQSKSRRRTNPIYVKMVHPTREEERSLSKVQLQRLRRSRVRKAQKLGISHTDYKDPSFTRLYYARYADDFLLAFSGPKSLAMQLQKQIADFLFSDLHLQISKEKSRLGHTVSNPARFLGVRLHAVPTWKLPIKSNKAVQAMTKYRKRVLFMAKAQEQRLVREQTRLGRKLLRAFMEKSLRLETEPNTLWKRTPVAQKVRQLVDQCAKGLLTDAQERSRLKHALSLGDILTNEIIAKQIPPKIICAFKTFQSTVQEELGANGKLVKQAEGKATDTEQPQGPFSSPFSSPFGRRERRRGGEHIIKQRVSLRIQIGAPIEQLRAKLKARGIISNKGTPTAVRSLCTQDEKTIIQWFGHVAHGFLAYYRCCDNFFVVKKLVDYHIRWSCLHTIAAKFKTTLSKVITRFSTDLLIHNTKSTTEKQNFSSPFPTSLYIRQLEKAFLAKSSMEMSERLEKIWLRTDYRCKENGCSETTVQIRKGSKTER